MHLRGWLITAVVAFGVLVLPSTVLAGIPEGGCPNEVLRTELNSSLLPDCRAYEMVTPSYKEGYSANADAVSPDGNKVFLTSEGAFSGDSGEGESATEEGVYLATRTSTGWQTTPLNAPLSEFVGQILLTQEAESGMSLWYQHTPQQSAFTRGLYIRSAEGAYTYVGRLNPNLLEGEEEESNVIETQERNYDRPLAATRNYEHIVIFSSGAEDYWKEFEDKAFDTTYEHAVGSVYEYSGTNNEKPTLVGVEGEKGSTSLIGKCGTVLGSGGEGSEYNALSADGESVIFTAEPQGAHECSATAPATAELFVRWHGSRTTASKATTVHVSENMCTEECGEESGKNFEGASENGERIFFTSTQKLTNDATNGTESGNASKQVGCVEARGNGGCNLYEFDGGAEGGHTLNVVAGGDEVLGVVAVSDDGARVYFVAAKTIASSGKNIYGKEAQEGEHNLYVYDAATKATSFVTTLAPGESDETDWQKSQYGRTMELAGRGGEFLLFPSSATVVPGEEAIAEQLYEYDAVTGELVRVSKSENGADDNGLAESTQIQPPVTFAVDFRSNDNLENISENGLTVVFESSAPISNQAISAEKHCSSVYEFRTSERISEGGVHLVSDGRDVQPHKGAACGATFLHMDLQGENILFSTADPLLASDVNGVQRDMYDARVDGGFPPFTSSASCGGSGCEGPSSAPPVFGAPASAVLPGSGDLAAPSPALVSSPKVKAKVSRCLKGKHRNAKGKCVKPVPKKRARGKKASKVNRGDK